MFRQPKKGYADTGGMRRTISMSSMVRLAFLASLSAASSACVLPPVRASAGGGGSAGEVVIRNSADELRLYSVSRGAQVRIGVTPMTLDKRLEKRRGDVSLGWSLDWQSAGRGRHDFRHGPYVEGVWFRQQRAYAERQGWRFGPTLLAELRFAESQLDSDRAGYGVAVGGLYELVQAVDGPILFGGHRGEYGIGLSGRIGVRHDDGGTATYAMLSVEIRTPGAAAWLTVPTPRPR